MKAKRKIDQKAIQQFFIDHTEKIVIGVVSLLFAYFGYAAVMRTLDRFPKTTEGLKAATDSASSAMQRGPADPAKAPPVVAPIIPYAEMIEGFKKPIDRNDPSFVMAALFDWKPYAPPRLRDTPEVYPAEKLRAVPGRGALASNEGGANGPGVKGQRWVAVTGLVPYRQQLEEYRIKFENSADESNMQPQYFGFLIQRAEVTPGEKGEPNWNKSIVLCNEGSFTAQMAKWNGLAAEVVDPRNTYPSLTSPLPPLTNADWNEDVAHPSEIKIPPAPAQNNGGQLPPNVIPGGRPIMPGGRGMFPGRGAVMPGIPGQGQAPAANGDNGLGALVDQQKAPQAKPKAEDDVPEYLLLRYFDFDVEAEKQYAYRAFVILHNPNYNLPDNLLEEAELASRPFLGIVPKSQVLDKDNHLIWIGTDPHYAKWSSYCISAKMPTDMRLLAGDTTPPKPLPGAQEATGEARVLLWGEKSGLNLTYHKPDLFRGSVLSFPKAKMKTPGDNKTTEIDPLDTKNILVDLAGGEPIVPRDRDRSPVNLGPGSSITLDDMGNLVIHDEMGEGKEWADSTKEPERPTKEHPPMIGGRRHNDLTPPPGAQGPDGPDGPDTRRRAVHGGK